MPGASMGTKVEKCVLGIVRGIEFPRGPSPAIEYPFKFSAKSNAKRKGLVKKSLINSECKIKKLLSKEKNADR